MDFHKYALIQSIGGVFIPIARKRYRINALLMILEGLCTLKAGNNVISALLYVYAVNHIILVKSPKSAKI